MTDPSPLYLARMENVKLVTELRELRAELDKNRCRSMEVAEWTKRFRKARDRAEAHRDRVIELEDAIISWYDGHMDENGLVEILGKVKQAA